MNGKNIEFIVDALVSSESELFTVIGRCGDEPIQVNDVFDAVIRNKQRRYPDEMGDPPVRECEKPASLRVVCIHAYERSLTMLGQGMTGALIVEGDGCQHVAAGWILGRRDEAEGHSPQALEVMTHSEAGTR